MTALAGQVLKVNGAPLAGASLAIEGTGVRARTDRSGRFLLSEVPPGRGVLVVDGKPASAQAERYGRHRVRVEIERGKTYELGYTVWMSPLSRAGDVRVASPTRAPRVLRTRQIPGLEVRIPKGSRIRLPGGRRSGRLNLTAVPTDRPPFPLPPYLHVPVYFTAQPGGAYLSKGARVIYPNYLDLAPGKRVDFWNYDPDDRGWYVYGKGTVTEDAKQVVPDPGVRIWEFSGAMAVGAPPPPGSGPHPGGGAWGGDPVDLATGLFV